jgi:hypothetical protein
MSDDEGLQVVSAPKPPRSKKPKEPTPAPAAPSVPAVPAVPAPTVSKPVVPKAVPMDAKYMDKLNKARELALVKKAQARMKQEEDAVNAKVAELKKQKEIELPPVVEPIAPVPVAAPIETPKPKRVRKKPEPKPDKVVERIVEVEKIVYQAPKLNFCFV